MARRPGNPGYSPEDKDEVIAHVLVQIATGRFVSRIFREDDVTASGVKMPDAVTFWKWTLDDEELDKKVERARARGIEALLDQCGEIADDGTNDFVPIIKDGEQVGERVAKDHILRSKLRIETRVRMAQMLKPKKYGPKLDVTSDGKQVSAYDALVAARQRALDKLDRKTD